MPDPEVAPVTFLVVDDSKVSRNMATALLRVRMPQARFLEAGDGAAAVAQFTATPADVVLMDYNMPGINGVEAALQILALAPDTRIALLTANGQSAVQAKAVAAGIHFLRKPIKGEIADQVVALAARVAA